MMTVTQQGIVTANKDNFSIGSLPVFQKLIWEVSLYSLEMGDGKAGCASVNFYAEPKPFVNMKKPGRLWHWGKILFEK